MADRMNSAEVATVRAGVPSINKAVFHQLRFAAHDPAAVIDVGGKRVVVMRDVELPQARQTVRADSIHAYEEFEPPGGLSGDREVRAAQSVAECLRRAGVRRVRADRSLSLLFADEMRRAGLEVELDAELGVSERRRKDETEVAAMRKAQEVTERAIEMALTLIGGAEAGKDGVLVDPDTGDALTSEAVMRRIDLFLMGLGFAGEHHIVAAGIDGASCHNGGSGPIRTGEPVIVDVFPRDNETGYHGDCTRCVVHGEIPEEVARMHAAVVEAKRAGIAACVPGKTGEDVHRAVVDVITARGFETGFPPAGAPRGWASMQHGTGHGLGLDLKEPPLLDYKGPELVEGDAVTVEPGLYMVGVGGIRIEDLVIVRSGGPENLNRLGEGLEWG